MKTKKEKLAILDDLIERAEREQYGVKGEMHNVVQETDMFIRNCAGRAISVRWASQAFLQLYVIRAAQNQIGEHQRMPNMNDTVWNNWLNQQKQSCLHAKHMLQDELTNIHKEIELYGDDESDTYDKNDPFMALRQRLAVIEEVNATIDELTNRIDELESRIDDMQTTIDDLRSTIDSMEQS